MPRKFAIRLSTRVRLGIVLAAAVVVASVGWSVYIRRGVEPDPRPVASPDVRPGPLEERGFAPSAPPAPYRFAGISYKGDATLYFLASGDRVIPVTAGSILDGDYRVQSAGEREITLLHLPSGVRQTIPLNVAPWPPLLDPTIAGGRPANASPLPPAVDRTTSPALRELSR